MYAITLSATGVYRIGQAGATPSGPGGWYLVFTGSSWTGSVVLAQNLNAPGSVSQPIASGSLTNVGYYDPSDGSAVSSGVAITATGNWQVDSTTFDLYLNYTHTAGSVTVTIQPGAQLVGEPVESPPVPAADVTRGTFGANIPDTGTYTFPTQVNFGTKAVSTTALATPSALTATALNAFASTVSGAALMGFGTTNDVALKNRSGTDVLGVTANTANVTAAGAFAFVTSIVSTTALATPSALAATQFTAFASTVSGASIMGFGTTYDVGLKNQAGTTVVGIIQNSTTTAINGTLAGGPVPSSVGTTPGTAAPTLPLITNIGGATSIATTGVGGKGGDASIVTGAGGTAALAVTAGTGGAGGDLSFTTGAGAASAVTGTGTGTGGKGGAVAVLTGVGGATSTSTGVNVGGASGALTLTTSAGGASTNGSSNTGGASGVITLATGNGGAGATAAGNSGAITLQTGSSTATVGTIVLKPGGLQVLSANWISALVGQVVVDGTYGAGVASLRLNGLTTAAVTNQTGTLLNAPVSGNATFWMPVSIAGTIKYIPCW